MIKYLLIFLTIACLSCEEGKEVNNEPEAIQNGKDTIKYDLINDNLYIDDHGALFLRAINNEDLLEGGTSRYVWINAVYCDSCWFKNENGEEDMLRLVDFVDTASFHFEQTDTINGGDTYSDKNHRYFHKWMADGGTITLSE